MTNTTEIIPDHQRPAVGDDIYLHPTAPPMRIEIVDPPNGLVLLGSPSDVGGEGSWGMSTWQFVINPGPDGGCRLLTRGRHDYSPDWTGLEEPARVWALSNRSDHLRDEPQDDARDQEAGGARCPAASSEAPVRLLPGRVAGASGRTPLRGRLR